MKLVVRAEGSSAVIQVSDDGAGIAADMLPNVFDLFVQSKRTLDRSDGGLGVGLTLVRALVKMHGGEVHASSAGEGRGTTMTVRIPLSTAPVVEPTNVRESIRRLPKGAAVAVIEDNADAAAMMCELIGHAGFECHTASDGLEGIELILERRPAAAIVDVGLPGLDGFEIAQRVRATPTVAGMFLIALTGYGRAVDRARALESGFDEHIVKPVDVDQLMRLLGRPRNERALDGVLPGSARGAEGLRELVKATAPVKGTM